MNLFHAAVGHPFVGGWSDANNRYDAALVSWFAVHTAVILVITPFNSTVQFFSTRSSALSTTSPFYVSPYSSSSVNSRYQPARIPRGAPNLIPEVSGLPSDINVSSLTVKRGKMATAVPSRFAVLSIEDDDFKPKKTQKSTTTNKNNNAKNKNDKPKQQQQQQQQANKKKQNKVCASIVVALFLLTGWMLAAGKPVVSKSFFPESWYPIRNFSFAFFDFRERKKKPTMTTSNGNNGNRKIQW